MPLHSDRAAENPSAAPYSPFTEPDSTADALRCVMATARCILWHADIEEMGNPKYLDWRPRLLDEEAAQRFLPIAKEVGEDFFHAWYWSRHPEDREACDRIGLAAVRAGQSYTQEFRCRLMDDSERWIREDVFVETVEPGRRWRATAVCTDISERKEREAEIEALNERLGRSMLEAHHRVKNSLQLVAAMLDMALQDYGDVLPGTEVRRIANHVTALSGIHDILTQDIRSNGGQSGTISSRLALTRLLDLLAGAADRFQFTRDLEDVSLSVQKATALSLVAQELVANSIKHGGTRISVAFEANCGAARLAVEDDGPGLPPDFESARTGSTGLTLVRTLSGHDLGGRVTFGASKTGGARVVVEFPVEA